MASEHSEYGCQHCESLYAEQVEMAKIHIARLCINCRNAFDVFIADNPAWQAFVDCDVEMQMTIAMTQSDGENRTHELRDIIKRQHDNQKVLREICKAWVHGEAKEK